ncbi:hypothetical protein OCK02_19800 [Rhizobium sp. TRM96647]|uniref:hypothetical protein n=1 Tax=unclassified Rhizobium TaxID=2613769 RepID=UPI0021E7C357|nr:MULTISPECIES: hypothetical protein [unclassified Rhizobium]MCV3738455.1 hypothetical protein [Rhizobium sp. TRM96647]MCV3760142.1 hypothetical protein [Rhizobium sp. TRM96650]
MPRRIATASLALVLAAASLVRPVCAQETPDPPLELRDAYATLLGLDLDGEAPVRDGRTDIYRSNLDNPNAPRLVTRLEVSGNECRVRTTSALQTPGEWAVLSLTMMDLKRVDSAVAYGSIDDLIAGKNPLRPGDPHARQLVLRGSHLQCTSRLSLADEAGTPLSTCHDRLDISMMDDAQVARVQSAVALLTRTCDIDALRR